MAEVYGRDRLEAQIAKEIARLNERQRRQILAIVGNPPDAKKFTPALRQQLRQEREKELRRIFLLVFLTSASQHGMAASRAAEFGVSAKTDKEYRDETKSYVSNVLDILKQQQREAKEADRESSAAELSKTLNDRYGPEQAVTVARTSTTDAMSRASEIAVKDEGLEKDVDVWRTERDEFVCEICKPLDGTRRRTWSRKFKKGPPAHIRCRCQIDYESVLGVARQSSSMPPRGGLTESERDDRFAVLEYDERLGRYLAPFRRAPIDKLAAALLDKEMLDLRGRLDLSGAKEKSLPVDRLIATQRLLDGKKLATFAREEQEQPIVVVKHDGDLFIWDGHHRALLQWLKGAKEVRALVVGV